MRNATSQGGEANVGLERGADLPCCCLAVIRRVDRQTCVLYLSGVDTGLRRFAALELNYGPRDGSVRCHRGNEGFGTSSCSPIGLPQRKP